MLISIIIPTREEEKAIRKTIEQLRKVDVQHEIIVSDAHSKDRTVEIAREYADVAVVFEGTKHTAGIGRNYGAKVAKGEFLAFVDADTYIIDPPAFFKRALSHFEDPRVVGVSGLQRTLPAVETWADRISYGIANTNTRISNALGNAAACGKFMLIRRTSFEKIGGFREELVTFEDGDLFKRLSKIGKTLIDKNLIIYHGARRPHAIGWPRMWYIWISNIVWYTLFDKAVADDWTPVR